MGKIMQKNVIYSLLVLCIVVLNISISGAGTIFKCKNQQGILIYQNSACKQDAETVTSWEHKEKTKPPVTDAESDDANKEAPVVLTLKQNKGGHYTADGSVDGKSLNFVVDTGASFVSLPTDFAHSAQIYCDDKIGMSTANGKTDACTAKIKELKFGPFFIKDVAAVIVPNLAQPLLGMNVLQLFKVGQEKGEMQISVLGKTEEKK
jgi:clan AA aspartic protease (TIGR02281 family)